MSRKPQLCVDTPKRHTYNRQTKLSNALTSPTRDQVKTSEEIRKAFLNFFQEKDHLLMPSSSLIPPPDDPTLLLTSAGMVQFKPYFMGERRPPKPRLTSVQKCFRVTDVD